MTVKKQLGDLLVEAGLITAKTLERALDRQRGGKKKLGAVLEEMGVITEAELAEALAKQLGYKSVKEFSHFSFAPDLLALIPSEFAASRVVFPLKRSDNMLAVAVANPFEIDTLDYITKKTGLKVVPVLAAPREIVAAIEKHYLVGTQKKDARKRILIVDDSQSVAAILQVALSKEGFNVVVAHDGLDGLKMALADHPDMIICDSVMPRMDGFALLRSLRQNEATADTAVILLTSKATAEDEARALDVGFIDFIAKPVQPIRVVARVKRAFALLDRIGGKFTL